MAGANILLGQQRSLIFMGAEGEPELYADRQKVMVKQLGTMVTRMRFDEAGLEAYPRTAMDVGLLKKQTAAMLAGQLSDREAVVVQRMAEAFAWASTARLADGWREEI